MIRKNEPLGKAMYEFAKDGSACAIYDPETPRFWYNYLWNELGYCAQVSQTGHGRSYYLNEKADMCMLNRDAARYIYLRDEQSGSCWNIGCGPLGEPVENYRCTHAIGHTQIESEKDGIRAAWCIFVPTDLYGECWTLCLENTGDSPRLLSVFPTVSFSLDGFSHPRYYEMYRSIETDFDVQLNGIYCRSEHPFAPHKRYNGYLASSEPVFAWDGDLTAFCGSLSTQTETDASASARYQRPERLVSGKNCGNSDGALFIPGAVLQHKLTLLPGERREIRLVFGVAETPEEARTSAVRFTSVGQSDALYRAEEHYREKYAALSVHTPDSKINHIMNLWVRKQVDFCIVGKKGVRDNLQIAVALLNYRPEKAMAEILECLRHQFRDGRAVLTWYPYDDTRYSDQPFWIIWAVCELIKETGDLTILDLPIAWQDGGEAAVLEHVKAAVRRLLDDRGRNGLVRILFADWNDALNIPPEEEAESVMLSEQFCLALHELERLMHRIGDENYASFCRRTCEEMKHAINSTAWDGGWYCRALAKTENIGSKDSSGSKIYLNAQTWAVLGGLVPEERLPAVLRAVDGMERDFGYPLNDPPYMEYDPMAGRMSGMLPGLFENGGVYCHASAFKILMDCRLGRGDDALRTLKKIMPDSSLNPSAQSGAEPYVFTNCYSTHPKYYGRSYQSWTTGTSAWCLRGLCEGILGVKRDYDGLRIEPAFPSDWDGAELTRRFRGDVYHIVYRRTGEAGLTVDGQKTAGSLIPGARDGAVHQVEVTF
ncbi:MAG: cellobiose phosphorylase [Lachnospiraceae bacterium]|nr:cellobiose phosphorylase [Lachnospiraceae bacterium]